MDESWRVPIGSVVPRRRSAEQTRSAGGSLGADDFRDVFGGPPRSVLVRQFSGIDSTSLCSSPPSFPVTDLNRNPKASSFRPPQRGGGRWVVRTEHGFYDDIFESVGEKGDRNRSWRSTSKSNSSSVVSSEDGGESMGGLRGPTVDDAALSSFASKLSPIIVPSRRRGATPSPAVGEQSSGSWRASTAPCPRPCSGESRLEGILILTRSNGGGSPFTSAVSSIYDDVPMATIVPVGGVHGGLGLQRPVPAVWEEEEEEGYGVIEIVPGGKATDTEGVGAVDEAIAWAKGKYRGGSSSPEETGVADGEGKQSAGREEEHEQVKAMVMEGRSREDGMLDVVTHLERLRGAWR